MSMRKSIISFNSSKTPQNYILNISKEKEGRIEGFREDMGRVLRGQI